MFSDPTSIQAMYCAAFGKGEQEAVVLEMEGGAIGDVKQMSRKMAFVRLVHELVKRVLPRLLQARWRQVGRSFKHGKNQTEINDPLLTHVNR